MVEIAMSLSVKVYYSKMSFTKGDVFSFWWSWTLWEHGEYCGLAEQRYAEQLLQQHPHRPQHHGQPAHCLCHPRGAAP